MTRKSQMRQDAKVKCEITRIKAKNAKVKCEITQRMTKKRKGQKRNNTNKSII